MDYRTKEQICRRISIGKLYHKCGNDFYVFKDPDQEILASADFFYSCFYEENLGMVMTMSESIEKLKEKKIWSDKKEKDLENIAKQIELLTSETYNCRFLVKKKQKLEKTIAEAQARAEMLFSEKTSLYNSTLEFLAESEKRKFIIKQICTMNNRTLLDDAAVQEKASNIYFNKYNIEEKDIREVSRTNPWRIFWNTSKELSSELFSVPATMMTQYQQSLVMWSFIYDFAFSNQNRPPEEVINNDMLFDKWYKEESDIQNKQSNNNSPKATSGGYGGQEVFIMADKEGSKKVYEEMNDQDSKSRIKERTKVMKEKGIVKDTDFKDVRRDLKIQQNRNANGAK